MKNRTLNSIFLLFIIVPISACGQNDYSLKEKVKSLLRGSVPLAYNEDVEKWKSAKLLDARELEEYEVSHLPKAIHVGDKKFKLSSVETLSKTDTIIVYCTVGYRSEEIGERLQKAGYENVYNLFGGIFSWKNGGHAVMDSTNNETDRIHCYKESWGIFLKAGEKIYSCIGNQKPR
jgi:rhodanese-related sulfurtransferase